MVLAATAAGCAATGATSQAVPPIEGAVEVLGRDLPGDFAALYDMRVSSSGGLRLAVVTAGGSGRMTISEPFGSAVSLTAWSDDGSSVHYDMERGCRRDAAGLRAALGLRALPVAQAVRLLGGRLPALAADAVSAAGPSELAIRGDDWGSLVTVAAEPWRVVAVREDGAGGERGWSIELDDHTSSVPGRIRVTDSDGRWAELELRRLEWPRSQTLPDLPDFPPCGDR